MPYFAFLLSGNSLHSQCSPCTSGSYCSGIGNTKPTGLCDAGFYCPAGQSNKQAKNCTAGHYCPIGSPAPILCNSGTWQDQIQQSSCKICPEGYYCDSKDGPIIIPSLYKCPNGYYCPNGTRYAVEFGCPNGTYGNGTGLVRASQCLSCPPGKYCLGKFDVFPELLSD